MTAHHRFLLRSHLNQIDALDASIAANDKEVDDHLAPFRTAVELLSSIFGVRTRSAQIIVSEIGTDLEPLPHCRSTFVLGRAGAAPRRKRRFQPPAPRRSLAQDHPRSGAWAASCKMPSDFQGRFHRLRRGAKKAICAVAASLLTAAYHMLKTGAVYHDLGPDHYQRRSKHTQTGRRLRRLRELGYMVEITPLPEAA